MVTPAEGAAEAPAQSPASSPVDVEKDIKQETEALVEACIVEACRVLQRFFRARFKVSAARREHCRRLLDAAAGIVTSYKRCKYEEIAVVKIQRWLRCLGGTRRGRPESVGDPGAPANYPVATHLQWTVKTGSVLGLLRLLCSPSFPLEQDDTAKVFFSLYRTRLSSGAVLAFLLKVAGEGPDELLRVLACLKVWVSVAPGDWEDSSRKASLAAFLVRTQENAADEAVKTSCRVVRDVLEQDEPRLDLTCYDWPTPTAAFREAPFANILDIHPLELARQLTCLEHQLFVAIQPEEYVMHAWLSLNTSTSRLHLRFPNISVAIASLLETKMWVVEEILKPQFINKQVHVLVAFVATAKHCLDLGNYSTLTAILWALEEPQLVGQRALWENVPTGTGGTLATLRRVMNADDDFAVYRSHTGQSVLPVDARAVPYWSDDGSRALVPHLGLLLRDLRMCLSPQLERRDGTVDYQTWQATDRVMSFIRQWRSRTLRVRPVVGILKFILRSQLLSNGSFAPTSALLMKDTPSTSQIFTLFKLASTDNIRATVRCVLADPARPSGTLYITDEKVLFLAHFFGWSLCHALPLSAISSIKVVPSSAEDDNGALVISSKEHLVSWSLLRLLSPSAVEARLRRGVEEAAELLRRASARAAGESGSEALFAEAAFERITGLNVSEGVPLMHERGSRGIVVFSFEEVPHNTVFSIVGGFTKVNRITSKTVLINGAAYTISPKMRPATQSAAPRHAPPLVGLAMAHRLRAEVAGTTPQEREEEKRRAREDRRDRKIKDAVDEAERKRDGRAARLYSQERQVQRRTRRAHTQKNKRVSGKALRGDYRSVRLRAGLPERRERRG